MSFRHIQGDYFFNRYVRFLSVPSATTTSSAINSRKIIFARDNPTPSTSAISRLVVETLFVRYSTITCFCAAVFAVTFCRHFFVTIFLPLSVIADFYHRFLSPTLVDFLSFMESVKVIRSEYHCPHIPRYCSN